MFQPTFDTYGKALRRFKDGLMNATNTVVMPQRNSGDVQLGVAGQPARLEFRVNLFE